MQLIRVLLIVAAFAVAVIAVARPQISRTDGTALTSGGTPSVTSCGLSPSVVGTDSYGTVTVGGGVVTACTLNFSRTLNTAPHCVVTPSSSAVTIGLATAAATATLAFSTSLAGGKVYYVCFGT